MSVLHLGARVLHEHRDALPAADTRGGYAVALPAATELHADGLYEARACRAQGVPEADGPTVHVALLSIEPQLFLAAEVLGSEGLVDLEEVDVIL